MVEQMTEIDDDHDHHHDHEDNEYDDNDDDNDEIFSGDSVSSPSLTLAEWTKLWLRTATTSTERR